MWSGRTARERTVETGIEQRARTQVVGEVRPGDLIVVVGQDRVEDGSAVRVGREVAG